MLRSWSRPILRPSGWPRGDPCAPSRQGLVLHEYLLFQWELNVSVLLLLKVFSLKSMVICDDLFVGNVHRLILWMKTLGLPFLLLKHMKDLPYWLRKCFMLLTSIAQWLRCVLLTQVPNVNSSRNVCSLDLPFQTIKENHTSLKNNTDIQYLNQTKQQNYVDIATVDITQIFIRFYTDYMNIVWLPYFPWGCTWVAQNVF